MNEYTKTCTGDVVVGDEIEFTEAVFGGSYRRPKYFGDRTIQAIVERDSYGKGKQQHTFTLRILSSTGCEPLEAGLTTRRKGRNVYKNGTRRKPWSDENERRKVAAEKHQRGDAARRERDARKEMSDDFYHYA